EELNKLRKMTRLFFILARQIFLAPVRALEKFNMSKKEDSGNLSFCEPQSGRAALKGKRDRQVYRLFISLSLIIIGLNIDSNILLFHK
ncbi:MAG: hypothetical protein AAGJ18_31280, partial [Bacteroidota bacterium]